MLEPNTTKEVNTIKEVKKRESSDALSKEHYPSDSDFKSINGYYTNKDVIGKAIDILKNDLKAKEDKIEELKDLKDNPSPEKPQFSDQNFKALTKLEDQEKPRVDKAIKWLEKLHQKDDLTIGEAWGIVEKPDDDNKKPELVNIVDAMKKAIEVLKSEGKLEETTAKPPNEGSSTKSDTAVDDYITGEKKGTNNVINSSKEGIENKGEETYEGIENKGEETKEELNIIKPSDLALHMGLVKDATDILTKIKETLEEQKALDSIAGKSTMDISNKSLESWIDVAQEAYETSYEKWKETLGITDTSTDSDKSKFHKKVFTDVYKSLSKYAGDQDTSNPQVQFGFNTAIQYIRDISNTNPEINALANRKVLAQLQAMDTNNENRDQANTRLAWKVAFTSILFAFAVAGCSYLLTTFISAGNNKDK